MKDQTKVPYPKLASWLQKAIFDYRARPGNYYATQQDLAIEMGIHPVTFGRYIMGVQRPSDEVCDKIALLLGIGVYEAAGRSPRIPPDPQVKKLLLVDLPSLTDDERKQIFDLADQMVEAKREREKQLGGGKIKHASA